MAGSAPLRACCVVVAMLTACGGGDAALPGPALEPAAELTIVARPADDLVFLHPALADAVQRGAGLTNVYVTAGAGDLAALERRIAGLEAAYAALAGNDAWACGDLVVGDQHVWHCRLAAAKLSLIFLGYPDGGADGSAPTSLLNLWQGQTDAAGVPSLLAAAQRYDQPRLIGVVTKLIDATAPTTLRTLEIAATHGRDASDHMLVGALAVLATAASTQAPVITAWRGDNIADAAVNVDPAVSDRAADSLARYQACATGCAACGTTCTRDQLDADQLAELQRSYPIAMHAGAGLLRDETGGCVTVTVAGANAAVVDCAAAPTWQLDTRGQLRASSDLCLRALFTGEIVATPCANDGVGGRFFLDDDGHVWSGLVPAPQDDMAFAHLDCLINAGGRPRVALCGASRAPTWQLAP